MEIMGGSRFSDQRTIYKKIDSEIYFQNRKVLLVDMTKDHIQIA